MFTVSMKRILTILLIFCLLVQSFTSVSFLTFYRFNTSFVAEMFCINKAKPALHCEGKCFLKKQLTKDKQTQEQSSTRTEVLAFHLWLPVLEGICLENVTEDCEKPVAFYSEHTLSSPFFSTFHPPRVGC